MKVLLKNQKRLNELLYTMCNVFFVCVLHLFCLAFSLNEGKNHHLILSEICFNALIQIFAFLLNAPQKLGVLALIDEESNFPKGTDGSMLDKLHSSHEV